MFYYLANPYNGTDELKQERFEKCCKATTKLLKMNIPTFSPIVHSHSLIEISKDWSLDNRRNLLIPLDLSILGKSSGMILITLDGWKESFGVKMEIEFCEKNNIPIHKFTYEEIINSDSKLKELQG